MPAFNSALLKIERAYRQTRDLDTQAAEFFNSTDAPYYRVSFERDTDPRKWRGVFRLLKTPPDDWPVIVGEIIHDLRSALDHLVYEASAPDENGVPLDGTGFPVFSDEAELQRLGAHRIRGLNDATRAFVIEKCQPFTSSDPEIIPFILLLHKLSNTDKHRLLNFDSIAHTLSRTDIRYSSEGGVLTPN